MLERLMTLQEVAAAVRVSVATLRRAVKTGDLPHVRAGKRGQIRIDQAALDMFLKGKPPEVLPSVDGPASLMEVARERRGVLNSGATYQLVTADVRSGLAAMETGAANCIVTSPPYYWQRDYGVDGQIGHEDSIQGYVDSLVEAFREAKRVLRDDGTLFLNLGDAYYNAKGRPHGHDPKHSARLMARQRLRAVDGPGLGLPRKSLIGLPWRVGLALQQDG